MITEIVMVTTFDYKRRLTCNTLYFSLILAFVSIVNALNLDAQAPVVRDSTAKTSPVILPGNEGIDSVHPGDIYNRILFTKEQDSAYKRAMALRIPQECRLKSDFRKHCGSLSTEAPQKETMWQSIERAFRVPQKVYIPLGTEVVQRYEAIQRSQAVDGMTTLPRIGTGTQVSFEDIGRFFGLVEDVSPKIEYELNELCDVEIVIYSIQATEICTIVRKGETPGKHQITWNGRDDNGMKVAPGDYVAEVKAGKQRIKTKRIRIN